MSSGGWHMISVHLPDSLADQVAAFIIEETGRGVEIAQRATACGMTCLKAWLTPGDMDAGVYSRLEELLERITARDEKAFSLDGRAVSGENWAESWKQYFRPVRVGSRFVIKPQWEEYEAAPEDVVIEIDPGQAFGVGTHASTALMLENIEWLWSRRPWGSGEPAVLDVGTGTGILGIAAARLGVRRVKAIDIDTDAVSTARANARLNGVSDKMTVSSERIDAESGKYDVVMANIDKQTISLLAGDLARVTAPDRGVLVVSGILREQLAETVAMLEPEGMKKIRAITGSGAGDREGEAWASIIFAFSASKHKEME